ncbi:E3 ubiquitin-protein ligase TTC3 [Mizuhopecten yessoensis]|uniref:RING-type E3 ubiquitin transferase n=1 Tax=Mizuhopecten yessoensis TaxID=6573 RepID=A0A210PU84_MIZYE|nr:E3 ubiquitin-protein ligase TTC3 [Mizuhopecten yessoensis]
MDLAFVQIPVSVHTFISTHFPDDIKVMADSDSDGIPDLVDSSDEEPSPDTPEKTFTDYANIWLKKSTKFLDKQESNIRVFAMGPFLFAVNSIVPASWMELVRNSGLIKYKKRETELSSLDWEEWAITDLVEAITAFMIRKLRKKNFLLQLLECINEIDNQKAEALTYSVCFSSVQKFDLMVKLCVKAMKVPPSKLREKEAKCAVLYIAKLYEMVVMSLARDAKDFAEEKRKSIRSKDATDPLKFKDAGNEQYQHGKFETAIDYYTKAAKADPFNHIFFGNRAQTYNRLKKYREALADGRRAVTLKPDWPKGHYRFAQAFNELGRLDQAIAVNKKGLDICKNNKHASDSNIRDLEHQGKDFRYEKDKKLTDEKLRKVLEENAFDDEDEANLPPQIRNLPGEKRIINLSRAFKAMDEELEKLPTDYERDDTSSSDEDPYELVNDDEEEKADPRNPSWRQVKIPVPEVIPVVKQNGHSSPTVLQKTNGKKKPDVPVKASEMEELERILEDANDAYSRGVLQNAATNFGKALELVNQYKPKHFNMNTHDVVALKYAYGESAVSTGICKYIMDGMEKFEDILANHQETKFPLAHYGRAKALVALNRFSEAKVPLATAWKITNNTKLTHVSWPGTKNKIEENTHNVLVKRIEELKLQCKYPPPADAHCRYHSDDEDTRTVIYFMDPDFKGFVRIRCDSQCIIEFHTQCWKVYKCKFGDMDRTADKEMLEKNCPTPECHAVIIKIVIFKQDKTTKEIDSDKSHKPPVKPRVPPKKLPACSEYKINRKLEKKELRRKRKQELKEEADDLVEDIDSMLESDKTKEKEEKTAEKSEPAEAVAEVNPEKKEKPIEGTEPGEKNPTTTAVLRRDDENDNMDKYKITKKQKPKRKKERERTKPTVLSLEVNFTDDHEKQLYGEHNADEAEEHQYQRSGREPFRVPNNLEPSVKAFEQSYHNYEIPFDDITDNLFDFFEDLLRAHGPLHVEDTKITSMFEDFPPEAKERVMKVGGLSAFLQQSKKFAMIDSIVCLLVDAGKARSISVARDKSKNAILSGEKTETLNPNATEFEPKQRQNAWNIKRGDNSDVKNGASTSEIESSVKTKVTASTHLFPEKSKSYRNGGGIDSLDDFNLNSPVKHAKPEARMHDLDSLDSIDDIDIFKRPKGNNSMDACEDIRWASENDTESVKSNISDRESISSRGDLLEGRWGDDRQDLPSKILSVDSKLDLMSRSSSRSDMSERSSDISDLMTKSYKSDRFSSIDKSDVSELMANTYGAPGDMSSPSMSPGPTSWPAPGSPAVRQGFGPIGSPVPSAMDNTPSSMAVNRPAPIGSPLANMSRRGEVNISPSVSPGIIRPPPIGSNFAHTLKEEVSMATQKECQRMDNKFVYELANDTVTEMLTNGMIPESERTKTLEQVSQDIWQDMNSQKNVRQSRAKTKKSMVDQYMKNHYEKKKDYPLNMTGFPSVTTSSIWSTGDDSIKNSDLSFHSFPPPPIAMPPSVSPYSPYVPSSFSVGQNSSSASNVFTQPPPLSNAYSLTRPSLQQFPPRTVTTTVAVQVSVETKTTSTLTDPYEPYKDDLIRAIRETDHLQGELQVATKQLQELTMLLQKRNHDYKNMEIDLNNRSEIFEKNQKLFEEKYTAMIGELSRLQQQLAHSQEDITKYQGKLQEAEQTMGLYEKARKQDKDKILRISAEKDEAMASVGQLKKSHDHDVDRATSAEVEVLKLRKQFTLSMLERSQKEAVFHQRRLGSMMQKMLEQNQTVPTHFQQVMDHYKVITPKCEDTIIRLTREFEDQIQQIKSGRCLSELPEIHIPPPPPAPPVLQHSQLMVGGTPGSPLSLTGTKAGGDNSPEGDSLSPFTMPSVHDINMEQTAGRVKAAEKLMPPKPLAPPSGPQPRPLAPPTRTLGFLPPRPLGPRPPLTAGVRPTLRPGLPMGQPKQNSFEKLLAKLQVTVPKYNRPVFVRLIQELRQAKGGSLSGATMDQIVNQIVELIHTHEQRKQQPSQTSLAQRPTAPKPIAPPPGLATNWAFSASDGTGEVFEEDEDPCVICYEEMTPMTTRTLDCSHRFHDKCIRKWLKEQSTCPNCRDHTLLSDEFPPLK